MKETLPQPSSRHILSPMISVEEIEDAVRRLSVDERTAFRSWFAEFDAEEWERQIEKDLGEGRLDWLISEAREDNRTGRTQDR